MIKIKSITDVITNSSTEVFVLNTFKSIDEVKKELKEITSLKLIPEYFNIDTYREIQYEMENYWGKDYGIYEIVDEFIDPRDAKQFDDFQVSLLNKLDSGFEEEVDLWSSNLRDSFWENKSMSKKLFRDKGDLGLEKEIIDLFNCKRDKSTDHCVELFYKLYKKSPNNITIEFWRRTVRDYIKHNPIISIDQIPDNVNLEKLDGKLLIYSDCCGYVPSEDSKNKIKKQFNAKLYFLG